MDEVLINEFYRWKTLLAKPEWQDYVRLLREHEEYLQKEVNRCIRENDEKGAIRFLAQKDLIPKLLGKVNKRVKTCKEK